MSSTKVGSAGTESVLLSLEGKDDSIDVNTTVFVTVFVEHITSVLVKEGLFMTDSSIKDLSR